MAENPPASTPASAPPAATTSAADAVAAATPGAAGIGNPRDVQGILALVFVSGSLAIAGVAIATGASALSVLAEVLPMTGTILGYYFGVKSQQA
jgi:hypothetical protein